MIIIDSKYEDSGLLGFMRQRLASKDGIIGSAALQVVSTNPLGTDDVN